MANFIMGGAKKSRSLKHKRQSKASLKVQGAGKKRKSSKRKSSKRKSRK
jgi:hypothetical protein